MEFPIVPHQRHPPFFGTMTSGAMFGIEKRSILHGFEVGLQRIMIQGLLVAQ